MFNLTNHLYRVTTLHEVREAHADRAKEAEAVRAKAELHAKMSHIEACEGGEAYAERWGSA